MHNNLSLGGNGTSVNINNPNGEPATIKSSEPIQAISSSEVARDRAVVQVEDPEVLVTFMAATLNSQLAAGEGTSPLRVAKTEMPPPPVVAAMPLVGVEGVLLHGNVAKFTNADPSIPHTDFTATIEWGDGAATTGIVTPDFSVVGSHTYVGFGQYSLRVTVHVRGGVGNSGFEQVAISNAPFTATEVTLTCENTIVRDPVASISDSNPFGVLTDYTAEISWGDGKSSIGKIVASRRAFKVFGSHRYEKKGKFTVTVNVRDKSGATATATSTITTGPAR